jgi:Domain of unknown function (DUF397)
MNDTRVWRKSSYSGTSANCVEVCTGKATVTVRDSKDVNGPQLTFTGQAWTAFVAGIKRREIDL